MKAKYFHNFSDEDFSCMWNKEVYSFAKGSTSPMMEEPKANHFAKHFVDRELTKIADKQRQEQLDAGKQENQLRTIRTDNPQMRPEMIERCLLDTDVDVAAGKLDVVINKKRFEEMNKKQLLKHAKKEGLDVDKRRNEEDLREEVIEKSEELNN